MWEKRKKEERLGLWIEAERERLSARAYALEGAFLRAIFRAVRGKHGGRCV